MIIDHIGYLTRDMNQAIELFKQLGFAQETEIITDDETSDDGAYPLPVPRNVYLCFLTNGAYRVELVSPINETSVVAKTLKKQGDGPYHLCYRTDNLHEKVAKLKSMGWLVVQRPAWAAAFGGGVAFLFKKNIGFIELRESK